MNPLTQIRNTQKASKFEVAQGLSDHASWHARYKHSAYVFAGGLPYDLTEGDVLAIFAQYGELIDVNLVKDKDTGKPRGFAFVAYEDQRSTTLAVDNLSGSRVTGRIIRVEHVDSYKRKKAEVEGRDPSPDINSDRETENPTAAAYKSGLDDATVRVWGSDSAQDMRPGPADGDAPWMNSNSIVSMLAEPSLASDRPVSNFEDASQPPKPAKSKQQKRDKDCKKRSKEKRAKGISRQRVDGGSSERRVPPSKAFKHGNNPGKERDRDASIDRLHAHSNWRPPRPPHHRSRSPYR